MSFFNIFIHKNHIKNRIPHQILEVISLPENYAKIPRQSHISQLPESTCYLTTTHKKHRQSTVEVLKMLSMLHTYKKYSLADNNLEVLYAAYGHTKRTHHILTSPQLLL